MCVVAASPQLCSCCHPVCPHIMCPPYPCWSKVPAAPSRADMFMLALLPARPSRSCTIVYIMSGDKKERTSLLHLRGCTYAAVQFAHKSVEVRAPRRKYLPCRGHGGPSRGRGGRADSRWSLCATLSSAAASDATMGCVRPPTGMAPAGVHVNPTAVQQHQKGIRGERTASSSSDYGENSPHVPVFAGRRCGVCRAGIGCEGRCGSTFVRRGQDGGCHSICGNSGSTGDVRGVTGEGERGVTSKFKFYYIILTYR